MDKINRNLSGENLAGEISEDIGKLKYLTYL